MQLQPIAASLTLLCIWLGLGTSEGKCAGKWAIHACGGGNGKRSDPAAVAAAAGAMRYPVAQFPEGGRVGASRARGRVSLKQMLLSLQKQQQQQDLSPTTSNRHLIMPDLQTLVVDNMDPSSSVDDTSVPVADSMRLDSEVYLRGNGERVGDNEEAIEENDLPRGYVPVQEMVREFERQQLHEISRRTDEQRLRELWGKLVASIKSRDREER